jgi:hypothetical protein
MEFEYEFEFFEMKFKSIEFEPLAFESIEFESLAFESIEFESLAFESIEFDSKWPLKSPFFQFSSFDDIRKA